MLTIYLIALILGGGLLAFSLFAGGETDDFASDVDSFDAHSDATDLLEPSADFDHHIDHAKGSGVDAVKFLSFRNAIYFLSFFGLTGTVLDLLSSSHIITLASAILMGFTSTMFGHKLMKYLVKTQTGEGVSIHQLIGKSAKVTLPIIKGRRGKILIYHSDQTFELNAEISESSSRDSFTTKDSVIIAEIADNTAYIIESDI